MGKAGKFKLETSKDDLFKGFKLEVKSDLAAIEKVVVVKSYTGIKDTQLKIESPLMSPMNFTAEATHTRGNATVGLKCTNAVLAGGLPDFGVRFMSGPFFGSLMTSKNVGTFALHASYVATPDVKVALGCNATKKDGLGAANVAVVCRGLYKVKACNDGSLSVSLKHVVTKGFTLLGGLKYSGKGVTYGCQLSID